MATAWVNTYLKEELIQLVASYGLDTTGTLDELRARMRDYIKEHPEEFANPPPRPTAANRNLTLRTPNAVDTEPPLIRMASPTMLNGPSGTTAYLPPPMSPTVNEDRTNAYAKTLNQMRKWGCQFDGRDPVAFLERVDELREGYGYTGEQLLRGLPELLRGDALLWARNNRDFWTTWEEFCADFRVQYFPPQYLERLQREIFERRQKENEAFTHFATAMVTLMRRAGGFSREQQLSQIRKTRRNPYIDRTHRESHRARGNRAGGTRRENRET